MIAAARERKKDSPRGRKHGGGAGGSPTNPVPSVPKDNVVLVLMFLSLWNPVASQTAAPS